MYNAQSSTREEQERIVAGLARHSECFAHVSKKAAKFWLGNNIGVVAIYAAKALQAEYEKLYPPQEG